MAKKTEDYKWFIPAKRTADETTLVERLVCPTKEEAIAMLDKNPELGLNCVIALPNMDHPLARYAGKEVYHREPEMNAVKG